MRRLRRTLVDHGLPQAPTAEGSARERRRLVAEAQRVFQAPTAAQAKAHLADLIERWQDAARGAVHAYRWGIHRAFAFYDYSPALQPLIRSTSLLEPFLRELLHNADEIGAFPDNESVLTAYALIAAQRRERGVLPYLLARAQAA
jgi:transposase-like protein